MSLQDYHQSLALEAKGIPFYALLMTAMRVADSDNLIKLRRAFPFVYDELQARYNAPCGCLTLAERNPKQAR